MTSVRFPCSPTTAAAQHSQTAATNAHAPQSIAQGLETIRLFISTYAHNGNDVKAALSKLNHPKSLNIAQEGIGLFSGKSALREHTLSNLQHFCELLQAPHLPLAHRVACATELAQGLDVCAQGEALNIQNALQRLKCGTGGVQAKVQQIQTDLIDQALLQFVRFAVRNEPDQEAMKKVEIHRVQALKNGLNPKWGISPTEDKYAAPRISEVCGPAVEALLDQQCNTVQVSRILAEHVAAAIASKVTGPIASGIPSNSLHTVQLEQALRLEFGEGFNISEWLEFSEDYATVRLKANQEELIQATHQMAFGRPAQGDITIESNPPSLTDETLSRIMNNHGLSTSHTPWASSNQRAKSLTNFAYSSGLLLQTEHHKTQEQEKERRDRLAH